MARATLHIGNRNYSSWSLRAWICLRHLDIDFETHALALYTSDSRKAISALDAAGKVPVLVHDDLRLWDSLAICEYASDLAGGRGWPQSLATRALARSISAEMHSGFLALRSQMPMNVRARRQVERTPELSADIARIDDSWSRARAKNAASGPWLFGEWSIADAMYTPVALRFATYGVDLSADAARYRDTVLSDPLLGDWLADARAETWRIAAFEVGTPVD
ncbi:glutathione S-transferase family protein [bacterium]|nr:MAG: glutathione S-transferase family protein [bacterium]